MWKENKYYYSRRTLQTIAKYYCNIYDGLPVLFGEDLTNPLGLAEFKADFDMALDGIGRGRWTGNINGDFKTYRNYGILQRLIIADIMGIDEVELARLHFRNIPQLRGYSYYLMRLRLNGGENE